MELSDIIQIIIGILSLNATIAVSFVIYWLQLRHEKEQRRLEEKQKKNVLEEKAKSFLMDHEEERDYLPWCVMAANLHRLERHTHKIYTEYCRCPLELQGEILRQAGFNLRPDIGNEWVDQSLYLLAKDIEKHRLGRNYLYDGAKYFHRAYERYRDRVWDGVPSVFEPIYRESRMRKIVGRKLISIGLYIDEYFQYFSSSTKEENVIEMPIPPMDYVWDSQGLRDADEECVCMWMMELVERISGKLQCFNKTFEETCNVEIEWTDAVVKNFEDKDYSALQSLYNTYYQQLKQN